MKSPFPGMHPWLEAFWGDVHHRLVQYACDQIQDQLPDQLRARVEERVFLESESGWKSIVIPDVRVFERQGLTSATSNIQTPEEDGGVAVAKPLVTMVRQEPLTEGYIEIRERNADNRIVSVIEVLSPANKSGSNGTREYLKKQREVISSGANLIEIDLLRRGQRIMAVPIDSVRRDYQDGYLASVHRGWDVDRAEVYGVTLRQRLPIIPIPLRPADADAKLDLQSLVDQAYRMGRYDDIDYGLKLDPPLSAEDSAWADEMIKRRGM